MLISSIPKNSSPAAYHQDSSPTKKNSNPTPNQKRVSKAAKEALNTPEIAAQPPLNKVDLSEELALFLNNLSISKNGNSSSTCEGIPNFIPELIDDRKYFLFRAFNLIRMLGIDLNENPPEDTNASLISLSPDEIKFFNSPPLTMKSKSERKEKLIQAYTGWIISKFLKEGTADQISNPSQAHSVEGMLLDHFQSSVEAVKLSLSYVSKNKLDIDKLYFLVTYHFCVSIGAEFKEGCTRQKAFENICKETGFSFAEREETNYSVENLEKHFASLWEESAQEFGSQNFDRDHFSSLDHNACEVHSRLILNKQLGYSFEPKETTDFQYAKASSFIPKTPWVLYSKNDRVLISPDIDQHGGTVFKVFRKAKNSRDYTRIGSANALLYIPRPDTGIKDAAIEEWNKAVTEKLKAKKIGFTFLETLKLP